MNDERMIGRLEEFKDWSGQEFDKLHSHIFKLQTDIDSLNKHRWFLDGKIVVISGFLIILARKFGFN